MIFSLFFALFLCFAVVAGWPVAQNFDHVNDGISATHRFISSPDDRPASFGGGSTGYRHGVLLWVTVCGRKREIERERIPRPTIINLFDYLIKYKVCKLWFTGSKLNYSSEHTQLTTCVHDYFVNQGSCTISWARNYRHNQFLYASAESHAVPGPTGRELEEI